MAKLDVVVGGRARSRGRVGEVMAVDEERALVTMRFDDAKAVHRSGVRDESLSEGDSVVGMSEVEKIEPAVPATEPVAADVLDLARAETGAHRVTDQRVTEPTAAQIKAVREAAEMKGRAEGLRGQELRDVQDEAEAELVSKSSRSA